MIATLILSAGRSSRFGSCKPMARLPNGDTLLASNYAKYSVVSDSVVCVIDETQKELVSYVESSRFNWIGAKDAAMGMGQSLASGVEALADARGWVVALADMPFIKVETLEELFNRFRLAINEQKPTIYQPVFKGSNNTLQPGHPVCFSQHFKQALLSLEGDRGAREIITSNRDSYSTLLTQDRGVIADTDTPELLAGYIAEGLF